jgi:hypothetical protein
VYDNEEKRNRIVCRSFDRVTGTMEDGTDRPCKGCPDWQWRKDPETGKRTKNCGTVVNMYSEDRATRAPFLIRFKRTSLPVIMQHLQKHHILRRMLPGGVRGHYPLFIYPVKLTCKMSDNGNYAIPVVERGEQLSNDEIISYARQATELRESFLAAAERLETQVESQTSAEAGDTSFDTDKFEQGAGQNFVE